MVAIKFLGGCREVGRSAIMVDSIILDYGLKPSDPPEFPLDGIAPKSLILSHGHLDHVGVAPNLMDYDPLVYMTPPTSDLSSILLKDSLNIMENPPYTKRQLRQFESNTRFIGYDEPFHIDGWEITLFNAGHIPGSASIYMERDVSILYTGDIRLEDTRLLEGADTSYPEIDVLIVESTYFGVEHPDRRELEKAFVESVKETLDNGGFAIIPAFAVGRTQEVAMILVKHGITPYVDGMGNEVARILERYPEYIKSAKELKKTMKKVIPVEKGKREEILKEPAAIVTTAGMLNGGPALFYISKLYNDSRSKIILTGYQVEGTNGDKALKKGEIDLGMKTVKLKMKVEQYDFSAHADDSQLKELVKRIANRGVEVAFAVHGEDPESFANWMREELGIESYAPKNGDVFVL
ncbi:RNA-metabolising metallo-beta-lactamase [Ferroglobus placidus DSM 10642]|uniref:RNA-metabolising metallo-beta-lactamase n=1 Tax=Ferroglobus placidus (strain DSM 10642 / AEDII12DO) TaxID=589924 RepID=D3RX06_FERPA|nr:MBL fold metallo-hydrolase [Ferroglobus placidus]ADC65019.1 RNA-metabolising metallo-beta-lactamase [Ferroglobus placidus DSM 10642]